MKNNRLFIAVKIPPFALEKIINIRNEVFNKDKINWEKYEKLHLTLKFIGDFDKRNLDKLIAELKIISADVNRFKLNFKNFGVFKRNAVPFILYAGIEFNREFLRLHSLIDNSLVKFGVAKEKRKFKPHLTLLRIKNKRINKLEELLAKRISYIKFEVDKFYLIQSELKPTGSVYTEIESFKLK